MKGKVLTIHEVRSSLSNIYEILTTINCHVVDKSVDTYDLDNIRKAWEISRDLISSKWTNQLL